MQQLSPLLSTDFYKTVHHRAYKEGLEKLTSYWTPRMTRIESCQEVVMFGLQAFIKEQLIERFNKDFFIRPLEEVVAEYKRIVTYTMGSEYADTEHIEKLHKLGYLPIEIKAIAEGTRVPIKVPMFSITNTHKEFAWLVNYLETYMSCNVWQPMTSATIADAYMKIIKEYYEKTGCTRDPHTACGDFSMRGMSSEDSACKSAAGHLLSFTSTATIPVINWLEQYYHADVEKEIVGMGTPSTEHSVMCTYGKEELECYRHLITEAFPKGNLSLVSDTYDYWGLIENILPQLKHEILNRDGKIIIRGDSGNPVDIICGKQLLYFDSYKEFNTYKESQEKRPDGLIIQVRAEFFKFTHGEGWVNVEEPIEVKGTVDALWDIFGGTINDMGCRVLDKHIATIYGDSITQERCKEICERLEQKGYATENVTFGIGSYTYQYVTRDTFGFCLKATHATINGVEVPIFKAPKTDTDNFKKSQRGLCFVYEKDGVITYKDGLDQKMYSKMAQTHEDLLTTVFLDGHITKEFTLSEIRERLAGGTYAR